MVLFHFVWVTLGLKRRFTTERTEAPESTEKLHNFLPGGCRLAEAAG